MLRVMKTSRVTSNPVRRRERVITDGEKARLQETVLLDASLDLVDFEGADLRGSRFERVSLTGCDFRNANLVGVWFLSCDLMKADFSGASLGKNSFFGSCLAGAVGLTHPQRDYVVGSGGSFRRARSKVRKRQRATASASGE